MALGMPGGNFVGFGGARSHSTVAASSSTCATLAATLAAFSSSAVATLRRELSVADMILSPRPTGMVGPEG